MSAEPPAEHDCPAEPSGTLEGLNATGLKFNDHVKTPTEMNTNEEIPLDWQEVIQLQAFSERKAWIEEKIAFLEKLPPIEVFAGLDAVRASAETVPGLPTREQLQEWMVEHDRIEKETEIFDSGELKKLREVTKAASKRNLSPEDTDLIELTLTTIYKLDKLLHLLRDRTEHLDLLSTRLTWEEHRIGAWVEYRHVSQELREFLEGRARWSTTIYDQMGKVQETPVRRGSVSSMTSVHSESSVSSSGSFSRSARFKQAETLSRDAAQFASRLSALRHGKIASAGKALDKLIDTSRRSVPDELLDEQDRLENKGIMEMENLGKFVLGVVMQWKKADEIYVESLKDQAAAQTLIEEIMSARRGHPTARQAAAYTSRADALIKRVQTRTNPASPISTFPRPTHPLYPDQQVFNDTIARTLSEELKTALDLSKQAGAIAKEYSGTFTVVKRVETLSQAAEASCTRLASIIDQLTNGIETSDGDGSPPDLNSERCLETQRHEVFLALMPSLLVQLDEQRRLALGYLTQLREAMTDLDDDCLDSTFLASVTSCIDRLVQYSTNAAEVRSEVEGRVAMLRDVRKVWATMTQTRQTLEGTRRSVHDAMLKNKYVSAADRGAQSLTPESPTHVISLPSLDDIRPELEHLRIIMDQTIPSLLSPLSQSLNASLWDWLYSELDRLRDGLDRVQDMCRVWQAVRSQRDAMTVVCDEVNDLQLRIEDARTRYDLIIQDVMSNGTHEDEVRNAGSPVSLSELQKDVCAFTDSLAQRVPLLTSMLPVSSFPSSSLSANDDQTGSHTLRGELQINSLLDPIALDGAVRTDINLFSMRLAGDMQALLRKTDHYNVAKIARAIDEASSSLDGVLSDAEVELGNARAAFESLGSTALDTDALDSLALQVDGILQLHGPTLAHLLAGIQDQVTKMELLAGNIDASVHDTLVTERKRNLEDARGRTASWNANVDALQRSILHAQRARTRREHERQLAETKRLQEERERLEAERLEAERLEQERQEAERLQRERLEAGRSERERLEAARLEAERLEKERREAERLQRERLEAERMEQDRLEAERLKQVRLEAHRLEQERIEAERLERERLEAERLEQERMEAERLEAERLERERVEAECLERERAESERTTTALLPVQEEQSTEERPLEDEDGPVPETGLDVASSDVPSIENEDASGSGRVVPQPDAAEPSLMKEDVFGLQVSTSPPPPTVPSEMLDLQTKIFGLRRRLRALSLDKVAKPSSSNTSLPTDEDRKHLVALFSGIVQEMDQLPPADGCPLSTELKSLQADVLAAQEMLSRINQLANLFVLIQHCDNCLSDLLEHIDSYPAPPAGPLLSSYVSQVTSPPEEQLLARVGFTKTVIARMEAQCEEVSDDPRATSEKTRVLQTWTELDEMSKERLAESKSRSVSVVSRPGSVISSGRNSSVSMNSSSNRSSLSSAHRKTDSYANLSLRPSRGRHLAPPVIGPKRSTSNTTDTSRRSSSRLSIASTTRSVSGSQVPSSSRLHSTTFASRQRTMSTTSNSSTLTSPKVVPATPSRPRAQTGQSRQRRSPTLSDASSHRSSASLSTWSRAPRESLTSLRKVSTPRSKIPQMTKKPYIPNPKNKLDVAVGDVVNNLPVNINIEVVADTWKDQSGKYWIGDQEPRLCFCRILRSQTVMVRVGGGWTELSKFIKNHFADLFRLMPESPPGTTAPREKWISSKTLLDNTSDSFRPQTPESKDAHLPSFALSTPSGRSPHSIKTTSSPGSPLTPLQFMRRAEGMERPVTPTKRPPSTTRIKKVVPNTPSRTPGPVWRP
ncbi:hypothetical protein GLOTRDRAFT_136260 [Gloeophyllum trabeum ATCC 11539]|uniref:GAR domain-containing protein n=1 Tax=Gloeophyllum trabeum (strain ATCC 11539 / FP-39264 / Madison 617) TaxID=670483 RepID=S7QHX8_GLOTA|nr:uncharacterized protein GLOTRDRAFT_136260 [Gloeophyllum trabeum ATCC 11539]EPQ59376.1 hypothetical protein GLOTRDRAFT_136260 [Gloeophyllum trabeum ATCC 11539]